MTIHIPAGRAGASALLAGFGLLALAPAGHAAFTVTTFATGAAAGATSPDSITVGGGSVFVEYGDGSTSSDPLGTINPATGNPYSSTIVQYSYTGAIQKTYNFLGSDDGLRYDPYTNQVWVLQNQDGNSALTILNPVGGATTSYTYANPSTTRGYDDAQFINGQTYLSVSNPAVPTDPVIVAPTFSGSVISATPVMTQGAAGISDPDSLDQTPGGGLLLTGGDDGALVSVTNPGAGQTVKTVDLVDAGSGVSGLDDATYAGSGAKTLLVADTRNNTIDAVTGDFTPGALYASVGSTHTLDLVDLGTGASTEIGGLFPANASPHGLAFLPAAAVPEPSSFALLGLGLLALPFCARRRRTAP